MKVGTLLSFNTEIKMTIREYYEQLYGSKLDNPDEIETFL